MVAHTRGFRSPSNPAPASANTPYLNLNLTTRERMSIYFIHPGFSKSPGHFSCTCCNSIESSLVCPAEIRFEAPAGPIVHQRPKFSLMRPNLLHIRKLSVQKYQLQIIIGKDGLFAKSNSGLRLAFQGNYFLNGHTHLNLNRLFRTFQF